MFLLEKLVDFEILRQDSNMRSIRFFYFFDYKVISCDAPKALECYPQGGTSIYHTSFASQGLIGVIYAMAPNKKKKEFRVK